MRGLVWGLAVLLLTGCLSTPPAPRTVETPLTPKRTSPAVWEVPAPTWPLRLGDPAPEPARTASVGPWIFPLSPVGPNPVTALPLPVVSPVPLKLTPVSRSWLTVAQPAPTATLPKPAAPKVAAVPKPVAKPAPKAEPKAPTTVPATPAATPQAPVSAPPTAAAAASLLPAAETAGAGFSWQDVNAVAGDAVTLHFDKTNWLYLDAPAQQKTLGFQNITRDKDATSFQFRPLTPGQYTLEFQRQDLANQSTDLRRVRLTVVPVGTRAPAKAPTQDLEISRQLAASGKTAEAVQKLLQSYRSTDTGTNLELARLLSRDGQDAEALTYLEKNLTQPGPDYADTLELGTRLAASREPQKRLPAYAKLWLTGTSAPSEDLYLQVFETLRTQKAGSLTKDWSARYAGWYPSPQRKDRYLYQLGQLLEEPGEGRDVQAAFKAYNEVVRTYPLSPFWKASGERAAYINRHFLQVR